MSMTSTLDAYMVGPRHLRDVPVRELLADLTCGTASERGSAKRELMARGHHNGWGQLNLTAEHRAAIDEILAED